MRTDGSGTLVVPASEVQRQQWTTQFIKPDGTERFAADSKKEGCFYVTGGGGCEALHDLPRIVIAEGYATAKTLEDAYRAPIVVAFSAENLKPVAEALRARYPDTAIVIAGDDDRHLLLQEGRNRGRDAAHAAAAAVGGRAVFPVFFPDATHYPRDLDPVTPDRYRAHCRAKTAFEVLADDHTGKRAASEREKLQADLLHDQQLGALSRLKAHSDFNDLARSAMERHARDPLEGQARVARQIQAALTAHPVRLPWDKLSERQQRSATQRFIDAGPGDGQVYEILPNGEPVARRRATQTDDRRPDRVQTSGQDQPQRRRARVGV